MRISSKIINSFAVLTIALFSVNANSQTLHSDKLAQQRAEGLTPEDTVPEAPTSTDFQSEAKQAILVDFNTDTVLYEKKSDERMFPSSMTKVLTMYLVFDQIRKNHISMDTEYTVSERSWKTGGSQMFLEVGDKVKVSDLIQGVIVQSGNDACVALAEGLAGSQEAFTEDMNIVAKSLGMNSTNFVNPDGLPAENHYTTARDLSTIARRLITDFPEYFHYYSQREFTYANITQYNRNKLLDIPDLAVDGMKTGYTEMGGYGMIATGVNNGRRIVAVVNGLESENERLKAARALIEYGYNNFRSIKLFNRSDILAKVKVWGGVADNVGVAPDKNVELLVNRREYSFNDYKTEVSYKEPWFAPVKKGDHVANLAVKDSAGKVVQQYPLYAVNDVARAGFIKRWIQKVKYLMGKK